MRLLKQKNFLKPKNTDKPMNGPSRCFVSIFAMSLFLSAAFLLAGCSAASHKRIIRIGHNQSTNHPTHIALTAFQNYINEQTLRRYDAVDINIYEANIFHTKMLIKDIDLQNYLFNADVYELPPKTRLEITDSLRQEMIEIFSGRNIY